MNEKELLELAKKISEWITKNADHHTTVVITSEYVHVCQDVLGTPFDKISEGNKIELYSAS